MEKWKIALIASLLLALVGFGIVQQNTDTKAAYGPPPTPPSPAPASVYIGKTLPPWSFKNWNQKPVPLASLTGKPAFIEIFRTGCSHCNDAAPFLVALHERYGPRGLKTVAIQSPGDFKDLENPETKWPDVQSWVAQKRIKYPVAFDDGSQYFQGTVKKQVLNGDDKKLLYPTMMFTDKTGKIDFAQTGFDVAKAIAIAVEMEKRFPTSPDMSKNAEDLLQWLKAHPPAPDFRLDDGMEKSFQDDLAQRLQGKE